MLNYNKGAFFAKVNLLFHGDYNYFQLEYDPMLWKGYVLANLCSFRNICVASSNETHSWILLEEGVQAAKVVSMCVKTGIPLMDPLSFINYNLNL
jgi:hypothetical protein